MYETNINFNIAPPGGGIIVCFIEASLGGLLYHMQIHFFEIFILVVFPKVLSGPKKITTNEILKKMEKIIVGKNFKQKIKLFSEYSFLTYSSSQPKFDQISQFLSKIWQKKKIGKVCPKTLA